MPFILLVGFCLWGLNDIAHSPPSYIDATIDNAPLHALYCFLVLSPVVLILGIMLNLCDIKIERTLPRYSWVSTPLTMLVCALPFLALSWLRNGLMSAADSLILLAICAFLVVPASLLRKVMQRGVKPNHVPEDRARHLTEPQH
jgi:hypothetical protein